MAKLACEVCGGRLEAKPDGMFECEFCGMRYDKTKIQQMVQEIRGTVKVEGTVSVKVEGSVQAEGLMKRASLALEAGRWSDAQKALEEALSMAPENGEIYLGLVMAETELSSREEIIALAGELDFDQDRNFALARKYAGSGLKDFFAAVDEAGKDRPERLQMKLPLAVKRAKLAPFRRLADVTYSGWAVVKADGTVTTGGFGAFSRSWKEENDLYRVKAIAMSGELLAALHDDGTVTSVDSGGGKVSLGSEWTDMADISAGGGSLIGVKRNGTVLLWGNNTKTKEEKCREWTDIVSAAITGQYAVGVKSDGTVVSTAEANGIRDWANVIEVSGCTYIAALLADGTVVTNSGAEGRDHVAGWRDMVSVDAGMHSVVGVRADGKAMATPCHESQCTDDVGQWQGVLAVASDRSTVAVTENGSAVFTGFKERNTFTMGYDRRSVRQQKLFNKAETFLAEQAEGRAKAEEKRVAKEQERAERAAAERKARLEAEAKKKAEEEARRQEEEARRLEEERKRAEYRAALTKEQTQLREELANLKGFFTGKRRKEIETRLGWIEKELKEV